MRQGFTLRAFLSVLAIIFLMIIIAFAVQRREKRESEEILPETEKIEQEESNNEEVDYEIINDVSNEEINQENENVEIIDIENNNNNNNTNVVEYNPDCVPINHLVLKAKQNLSSRINITIDLIETVSCQENVFSDYTLGTSYPGEIYNQTPTKGYVLIFSYNNQEYRYHVNENNIIFIN